ncbi:hypothetical protein D1BOALGB6SA_3666 [Olavius sp. associated proteobacterium Delta 1]|nr:hypothetical protein D1BOALGB6SA_3666 [Olavius sp. associated proteobacterium Delta 1]
MFKKLAETLFGKGPSEPSSDGFFLNVRCSECSEQFNLFINTSHELMQNFETDGSVNYSLKKEVFGVGCKNRIYVRMKFDGSKKLVSREIENGEYIEEKTKC